MEKEFNLKVKSLGLNVFSGEEPPKGLKELLLKTLNIIEGKLPELLGANFKSVEINLNIVDDAKIQELNAEFREKDKATDVLSFPLQENVRRGEYDDFEGRLELGDVFIATGVCSRQAQENNLTFDQEFVHLFTHGFLHLSGYDHEENDEEDRLMRKLENEIMDALASLKE